jgi:hypothetical protein
MLAPRTPSGLAMKALLMGNSPAAPVLLARLVGHGLPTSAFVETAAALANQKALAEDLVANLAPLRQDDRESSQAQGLLEMTAALARRTGALPLVKDLVERLGTPVALPNKETPVSSFQDGKRVLSEEETEWRDQRDLPWPLRNAVKSGDVEVVRYLLDKNAERERGCEDVLSALYGRKAAGKSAIKSALIKAGVGPVPGCNEGD